MRTKPTPPSDAAPDRAVDAHPGHTGGKATPPTGPARRPRRRRPRHRPRTAAPEGLRLVIAAQNIGKGALALDHHPDLPEELYEADRWPRIVKRFQEAPREVDILVLNECNGWDMARLEAAAADLGMEAIGIAPSPSGYATAFLYRARPGLALHELNTDHAHAWHHGGGVAAFVVAGLPQPLAVVGAHVWPANAGQATAETAAAVYMARKYGELGVYIGDFNFPGLLGPPMDESKMLDHNYMARMINPPPAHGPIGRARNRLLRFLRILPRPNKRPARELYHGGLRDVAEVLHLRTRIQTLARRVMRRPFRNYRSYTCPSARIDIVAATKRLVTDQVLVDYWVLDTPHGASDHHGVMAEFDLSGLDLSDLQPYY